MLILVIVVSPGNSLKLGNSNDNGFITMTDSYTTGWDTTLGFLRQPNLPANSDVTKRQPGAGEVDAAGGG
jgi:hypothetical protein